MTITISMIIGVILITNLIFNNINYRTNINNNISYFSFMFINIITIFN